MEWITVLSIAGFLFGYMVIVMAATCGILLLGANLYRKAQSGLNPYPELQLGKQETEVLQEFEKQFPDTQTESEGKPYDI